MPIFSTNQQPFTPNNSLTEEGLKRKHENSSTSSTTSSLMRKVADELHDIDEEDVQLRRFSGILVRDAIAVAVERCADECMSMPVDPNRWDNEIVQRAHEIISLAVARGMRRYVQMVLNEDIPKPGLGMPTITDDFVSEAVEKYVHIEHLESFRRTGSERESIVMHTMQSIDTMESEIDRTDSVNSEKVYTEMAREIVAVGVAQGMRRFVQMTLDHAILPTSGPIGMIDEKFMEDSFDRYEQSRDHRISRIPVSPSEQIADSSVEDIDLMESLYEEVARELTKVAVMNGIRQFAELEVNGNNEAEESREIAVELIADELIEEALHRFDLSDQRGEVTFQNEIMEVEVTREPSISSKLYGAPSDALHEKLGEESTLEISVSPKPLADPSPSDAEPAEQTSFMLYNALYASEQSKDEGARKFPPTNKPPVPRSVETDNSGDCDPMPSEEIDSVKSLYNLTADSNNANDSDIIKRPQKNEIETRPVFNIGGVSEKSSEDYSLTDVLDYKDENDQDEEFPLDHDKLFRTVPSIAITDVDDDMDGAHAVDINHRLLFADEEEISLEMFGTCETTDPFDEEMGELLPQPSDNDSSDEEDSDDMKASSKPWVDPLPEKRRISPDPQLIDDLNLSSQSLGNSENADGDPASLSASDSYAASTEQLSIPNYFESDVSSFNSVSTPSDDTSSVELFGVQHRYQLQIIHQYTSVIKIVARREIVEGIDGPCNIVVFCAHFLPEHSTPNYGTIMDYLFLYCVKEIQQVANMNYVIVYFNAKGDNNKSPTFTWLQKCYGVLDRTLRKNLQRLYLVHPSLWTRTLLFFMRPFISVKFANKLHMIYSLDEMQTALPMVQFTEILPHFVLKALSTPFPALF